MSVPWANGMIQPRSALLAMTRSSGTPTSIRSTAESMELDHSELLSFLCECAEESCTTVLQLSQHEYEAVRAHPTHFINARGHAANGGGWVRVLDEFDRYTVVERVGEGFRYGEAG